MPASSTQDLLVHAHLGDLHITRPGERNYHDVLSIMAQIQTECAPSLDFHLPAGRQRRQRNGGAVSAERSSAPTATAPRRREPALRRTALSPKPETLPSCRSSPSLAIDQFGLFGFEQHSMGTGRSIGAALMVAGIVLIAKF